MWTRRSCTCVFGKTDWMVSEKSSTQVIKMSWTPRFFNSVMTCNQNLTPSVSAAHSHSTYLRPGRLMAKDREMAVLTTRPCDLTLTMSASK